MNLPVMVKDAGVIGAGGAGFPTYVKLQGEAEFIILNGAECEPLLRVDQQLMAVYPEEIIKGLVMSGKHISAKKALIGIKVKHEEVINILEETIKKLFLEDFVKICPLDDAYPAGDEQVLVYETTGRVVPEKGIPINAGCVVINSETALNIYKATKDVPVIEKYVTIAGDVPNPITLKVPVGTPVRELLKKAGRKNLEGYRVIDGGPMMGPLMGNLNSFVTKKTKGLLVFPENHNLVRKKSIKMESVIKINKGACEQCRMCTDMCPRALLGHSTSPHKMVNAMAYGASATDFTALSQLCCQCNLCEYFVCPAGIHPKMANKYYIEKTAEAGIKYKSTEGNQVHPIREYRKIPSKRLMGRIGILEYDCDAPLDEKYESKAEIYGIYLGSHIGTPAEPVVVPGDSVLKGELVGKVPEGSLGVNVHASVSGTVLSVTDGLVRIRREPC